MYQISALLLTFALLSCTGNKAKDPINEPDNRRRGLSGPAGKAFIANNCVSEDFAQGQDDNLYGLRCIEDKQILIKTSKSGTLVKSSTVSESGNLRIGPNVDFMNKYYNLAYTVSRGAGDDKEIPFLLRFFPESEDFTGSKDTEYKIVFKTQGDHLVLFKGSKKLQDIPFTERTSLKILQSHSGKMKSYDCKKENTNEQDCIDKSDIKEGDYYMVPFIGYPIQYCNPETVLNVNNERTRKSRLKCTDSHLQEGDYIKITLNSKTYNYNKDLKVNFLPRDYFKGNWYFSIGMVEGPADTGERSTSNASLIKAEFQPNQILLIDNSGVGRVSEEDKQVLFKLPVNWLDFEPAQNGQGQWGAFGERKEKNNDDEIKSAHVSLNLSEIKNISTSLSEINMSWPREIEIQSDLGELEDLKVEKDYLSFSYRATLNVGQFARAKDLLHGKQAKWTISLLRLDSKEVDSKGFSPRRFFFKDFLESRVFGVFPVLSQKAKKVGESDEEEVYDHARMKRFNLLLTEEQKKADRPDKPFKILKWYFSTNSTKDPEYRAVARKAVDIYDRAFKYISQGKIGVELVEGEEKDLGDLRYNLINLVEKDSNIKTGLLGWGPSYANPDTGQIIGSTANIFITPEHESWFRIVRRYLRYELFEKDQKTDKENKIHVVSPYTISLIEENCSEGKIDEGNIIQFVSDNKAKVKEGSLDRSDLLRNREGILACSKKILQTHSLLSLILHEMGHNFGLTHNFKASADKKNYYGYLEAEDRVDQEKAISEIKTVFGKDFQFYKKALSQSSSVMDYINAKIYPDLQYLGKYDLAALRYLYLDELEDKEGEIISLEVPSDLEKQQPLTIELLEKRKDYLHCTDRFNRKEPFCFSYDYGATPKEIVGENFLNIKMLLNFIRYRYDSEDWASTFLGGKETPPDIGTFFTSPFLHSLIYYNRWTTVRDAYLKSQGIDPIYKIKNTEYVNRYKEIIEAGNIPGTEYALYYPLREKFFKEIMELMDYDEMTCHVRENTTGKKSQLALEDIKLFFTNEENRKVKNCKSFNDVFKQAGLTLEDQTGFENFQSYYPFNSNTRLNRVSVSPINFIFIPPGFIDIITRQIKPSFMTWVQEPDLLQEFRLKTEKAINLEDNLNSLGVLKSKILLSSYRSAVKRVSGKTEEKQTAEKELTDYSFGFRRYYLEAGHESSFDNLVEKPLRENLNIDNLFLAEAYKDYISHDVPGEYKGTFQQYLIRYRKHEIIITKYFGNKDIIITPYQKDSFAYRMLQEYHDKVSVNDEMSLKKLNERIESSSQPSLVDLVQKIALERYTNELLESIKRSSR